ncbi:FMN-binding negative transcriptional regulator [Cryptosporangium aurantiacum]|uniref:Negative transcriptional regulator, PaiB family n=1 Tax=Cryptosporangium aurantiacum TaxID=134849 RepID=A0A1M7R2Z8_9ACTN|nr:FMN-binding negative transcriptional regulator [Cryptosporangium aurantiacum]SHN39281.1 negative transcriptional regulator, PaiB family [Cryptosporangium aurantiacum]
MRHNPHHFVDDPELVRRLIQENPWAILVSDQHGLVASHYPVILDEDCDELAVFTHVGRPDEELHGFGQREVVLIVQGVHGYVSPSWYAPGALRAPTWNFTAVHCYGVPEILDEEANLETLARLVEHFERHVESPMLLDLEWAKPIARGTVGLRLPISRFECKVKMSQDKDRETQRRVISALRASGAYSNPRLAAEMQRTLSDG